MLTTGQERLINMLAANSHKYRNHPLLFGDILRDTIVTKFIVLYFDNQFKENMIGSLMKG